MAQAMEYGIVKNNIFLIMFETMLMEMITDLID